MIYGKGSIKENGIYDKVVSEMKSAGVDYLEFSGIKPNPVVEDVDRASVLARKEKVDVILAVGGGSVIDSAKIMAVTIPDSVDAWDFYSRKAKPRKALPLVAVLTLAATGTEMNPFAVLLDLMFEN